MNLPPAQPSRLTAAFYQSWVCGCAKAKAQHALWRGRTSRSSGLQAQGGKGRAKCSGDGQSGVFAACGSCRRPVSPVCFSRCGVSSDLRCHLYLRAWWSEGGAFLPLRGPAGKWLSVLRRIVEPLAPRACPEPCGLKLYYVIHHSLLKE